MAIPNLEWTKEVAQALADISAGAKPEKARFFSEPNCFFAHYTSAENLNKILSASGVYMRNTRLMNDRSEVSHGFESVIRALHETDGGQAYQAAWGELNPDKQIALMS